MGWVAPALEVIGMVTGAIAAVDYVDTAVGSPLKDAVGLTPDPPSMPPQAFETIPYDVDEFQATAKDRAQGLSNYFDALNRIAPTFVASNRRKLTANYDAGVDRKLRRMNDLKDELEEVRSPIGKLTTKFNRRNDVEKETQ
jgi:hypothetical protein